MSDKIDVCAQFKALLEENDTSEQDFQSFLENHTEMFHSPFEQNHGVEHDILISKLKIDTSLTTDFAYLAKSSAVWWLVLVEIEQPGKKLFTQAGIQTADFTAAINQVNTWRRFVERNPAEVARRIAPLKKPLPHNKLIVKYVLIYGRSNDFKNNQEKIDAFQEVQRDDFIVLTYDSLVHSYEKAPNPTLDVVRQKKEKFEFKYRHRPDTSIFAWLSHNDFDLSEPFAGYYRSRGYDIDSWLKGEPLTPRITIEATMDQLIQSNVKAD
jgi:hypothetical protein